MKNAFYLLTFACIWALSACNANLENITSHEWKAVSIRLEDGSVTSTDSIYSLVFENTRQFRLLLDVNTCGGEVTFRGQSVHFQNSMTCTEACCDSEFANNLAQQLVKAQQWEMTTRKLIFTNDNGLKIEFVKK